MSAVKIGAAVKASTYEDSSRFTNEPRLTAAEEAALRGEIAEGESKCCEVLCQGNSSKTAKIVADHLARTQSESVPMPDLA